MIYSRHFEHIFENDRNELMHYSMHQITAFLTEKSWALRQELLLKFITRWVGFAVSSREDQYIQLLNYINWGNINTMYISDHLDKEGLYSHSHEALFTILHVLDRNGIYLGPKFQEIYQGLQVRCKWNIYIYIYIYIYIKKNMSILDLFYKYFILILGQTFA